MKHLEPMFVVAVCAAVSAGLTGSASAGGSSHSPPSPEEVAFAQQTSDLMLNELLAALFTEFDETTPENVPNGKQAISLIFNDANRDMRLIGTFSPLLGGRNDLPADSFERASLSQALAGTPMTSVEKRSGDWVYRRSVPLSNTFHPNCVLCHANFTQDFFDETNNPGQWVGELVLTVPIKRQR
jgi:hypothetical protein